jgi:hypothetical protein
MLASPSTLFGLTRRAPNAGCLTEHADTSSRLNLHESHLEVKNGNISFVEAIIRKIASQKRAAIAGARIF